MLGITAAVAKAAALLAKKKVAQTGIRAIAGDVLRGGKDFVKSARGVRDEARALQDAGKDQLKKFFPAGKVPPLDTSGRDRALASANTPVVRGKRNVKNSEKRRRRR